MNLRIIRLIAFTSIYEFIQSKFSYLIIFFIFILVYVSLLLGVMAVGEEKKILMDFFLSMTQIGALFWILIMLANGISSDIETKRIYLIFSRPVRKSEYILGKFIGVIFSSIIVVVFINIVLFLLFAIKKYTIEGSYLYEVVRVFVKILVISSVSLMFTLITTSVYSSFIISMMVWFASHFISELKFALSKIEGSLYVLKYFLYLFPDFSLLETGNGYVVLLLYFIVFTTISIFIFERKEIS